VTIADHGPLILAAGSMLDVPATVLVDVAARAGFDGVGLRLSAEHAAGDVTELRSRADHECIVVHDTEVYRIGHDAPDPGDLIDRSAAVGARALLVVSDLPDRSATIDALGDLVERSRASGLQVGLEYMAWTTPSTPGDAVAIARQVGCVVVVDLLHHVRVGGDVADLDAVVDAGVLGWVQLCDAPAAGPADLLHEARHDRLLPGHGALPVRELLASVPAGTPISVEVQSDTLGRTRPQDRAVLLHDAARSVLTGA
jgi:sugar phosphate isomerase/epimerase